MSNQPIIEMKDVHMVFPGVHALKGVNFDLYPGEVHAIVGENGAGKSTLIKIISGVNLGYTGTYLLRGSNACIDCTADAIGCGISVIYQELNLVGSLSVAENIFFGRLPSKHGRVLWSEVYEESAKYMSMVGLHVDPSIKAQYLSVAQQQLVEIAKALSLNSAIIIMDEPTSALAPAEIDNLFEVIEKLKSNNVSTIYISHKLEEIFEVADRVSVFKDGAHMGTMNADAITQPDLIERMVGRQLSDVFPEHDREFGKKVLEVENLTTEKSRGLSFYAREGEIVGFSGLMGAGRTEMTMALFGVDKREAGQVTVDGKKVPENSPLAAREAGMGLVVEDRRRGGIFPSLSVQTNMTIVSLKQLVNGGVHIVSGKEEQAVDDMIAQLDIRTSSKDQLISKLSGGNQQKVLLARWLLKENLKVLVVDEPTRGIDVGAKSEIYNLLHKLAKSGLAVVIVSSEMPEILGMCDRIYVMKENRISAEFDRKDATEAGLLENAI